MLKRLSCMRHIQGDCLFNLFCLELLFIICGFFCGYVYMCLFLLDKRQVNLEDVRCLGIKLSESPKKKIDPIDLQIIQALEENIRVSLRKLAHKVGITSNILHDRLKGLEHEGIILGYAAIIDSTKMGYALTAIIKVQVECGHIVEVENEIAKENNVLSAYAVTGEFDLIVFAKFRDNASLNCYLKKLLTERFIKRTTTMIAFNAVKEYTKVI